MKLYKFYSLIPDTNETEIISIWETFDGLTDEEIEVMLNDSSEEH